ncbi:hypothetical protein BCR34DRAFT_595761 [Clohesyomyces aquaticus]|uniref:Uncharacterized protein n=1 Tax=Clohesyomyces aquaticus TaxID=1231657 RepID=A0A1Y2A9E5_9PLEO|nr:hypothetical protein BCR34DRAFT_595761 [Clohesyomyces aquaticus]
MVHNATSNTTQLLPWGWSITPQDDHLLLCPSASRILGTFALVNALVTALSIPFGNRVFLNWLTHRRFFKNPDSVDHRWTWIITVGLQLSANALVGYIFQRSPGYNANFKIWELMLFFTVRPRLSWIALTVLGLYERSSTRRQRRLHKTENSKDQPIPDRPWGSAAKSQAFAEVALQIMALYVMGTTVHFGARHGYYKLKTTTYKSLPLSAHLMYSGAMFYLVSGCLIIFYELCGLLMEYGDETHESRNEEDEHSGSILLFVWVNLTCTWMASWIFWAGFVRLAGNQYCPPKLYAQGSIWGAFSLFGIAIGAGAA